MLIDRSPPPRAVEPRLADPPAFKGSWSELPLPGKGAEDLPAPRQEPAPKKKARATSDEPRESSGPIGTALGRALEMVRGDAYVLFLGIATVVIIVLVIVLLALR